MCKVTVVDEDGNFKTCYAENETINKILRHFKINPALRDVYVNGSIVSTSRLTEEIPRNGSMHIVVTPRSAI